METVVVEVPVAVVILTLALMSVLGIGTVLSLLIAHKALDNGQMALDMLNERTK